MNYSNNGFSVLSGAVAPGDTIIALAAGTGSRFPASDFLVTLIGYDELGNENKWEICKCSSRDGDALTVVRAQEGTTASAWPDATRIENRVTAGAMADFVSKNGVETLANKTLTNPVINEITGQRLSISLGGSERFRLGSNGELGVGGANFGSAGQVLISSGPGAAPTWGAASASIKEVDTPANTSPANSAAGVIETPQLTGSPYYEIYGASQSAIQVQVSTSSSFSSPLYSSGDQAAGTSFTLPPGILSTSTQYYWRIRYKSARGTYSDWSVPTSFVTAAQFNSYIPAPVATPANYGDPFEGGFYYGLLWQALAPRKSTTFAVSSNSKTLATGEQSFTVNVDMDVTPVVYGGQTLEVRSRANPSNKFIGVVTGARGNTITLNVTSIGGGGTFSDWSFMSRYRLIASPKATGDIAGIAIKNSNSALPAACQTLTEGWASTMAMFGADSAGVYPAAHAVRNLVINGFDDFYIPARDELEPAWRNLKPTTDGNYTTANRPTGATPNYANSGSYGDTANTHGLNNNSAPVGAAYTSGAPAQTAAAAFRTGGAEAFEYGSAYYWSSSEYNASNAWSQYWGSSIPGNQTSNNKTNAYRVRAVRRSII